MLNEIYTWCMDLSESCDQFYIVFVVGGINWTKKLTQGMVELDIEVNPGDG